MSNEFGQTDFNYWVVVVATTGPELLGPSSEAQLLDILRRLYGRAVQVFPFRGQPVGISTGPARHVMFPEGRNVPLCPVDGDLELDPDGFLFDPDKPPADEGGPDDESDEAA